MKQKRKWTMALVFVMMLLCSLPMCASAKTSVKLNAKTKTITVGKTYTLKATVTGTKKKVAWTSSNATVATVNKNGKVTAKSAGKAVIRAKVNGKTAKCTVTVKKNTTYAKTGVYLKETKISGLPVYYANPSDCLVVVKKSGGKIKFVVEHYGLNGSPIYQTNTITTKLNGNKTGTFKWKDSWGNSGTGRLTFKKNKVTVKMNVKKQASVNRWLWLDSITLPYTDQKLTPTEKAYYADINY